MVHKLKLPSVELQMHCFKRRDQSDLPSAFYKYGLISERTGVRSVAMEESLHKFCH